MVTKAKKFEVVEELKDKLSRSTAVYTTEQSGLSDVQLKDLRKQLREVESEIKIAKNTLMGIAAKGTDYEELAKDLVGPTALLFCYGDTTAPAGKVKTFSKEADDKIKFKGAVLDGELLDAEKATTIASLPSKDVLLSQIAGMLTSSATSIAYILQELGEKDDKDKLLKDFIAGEGEEKAEAAAEQPAEAKAEEAAKVDAAAESKPEGVKSEEPKAASEEVKEEDK